MKKEFSTFYLAYTWLNNFMSDYSQPYAKKITLQWTASTKNWTVEIEV